MYRIDGKKYQEDPDRKLGAGSEGAIYPFPDDGGKVVKIFHEPEDNDGRRIAKYRGDKISAITGLNLGLPRRFILPQKPAIGSGGKIVGFLMDRVPRGYVKFSELLREWRVSNSITLSQITALFARLIADSTDVHSRGLVIGDINTGLIMIRLHNDVLHHAWVDTDSWSYPGYPCLATTEMFCHPALYSNLSSGGSKFVPHKPEHDIFSFAVLFMLMALRGGHPFRMGSHDQYITPRDRAINGITIFDSGVHDYPKILTPPDILGDDIIGTLISVLNRKEPMALTPEVLEEFRDGLTDCPKCGIQYHSTRHHCPACHATTVVDMHSAVELVIKQLYGLQGNLLFMQVINDRIHAACTVGGTLHIVLINEKGEVTEIDAKMHAVKGAKYRFFGQCVAICENPYAEVPVPVNVYRLTGSGIEYLESTSTGSLEGSDALLESSARFLYRTAGNTLMCSQMFGNGAMLVDEQVTQVHRSQTWFTVCRNSGTDHELVVGFDRALREMRWFLVYGTKEGTDFSEFDISLPPLRSVEKLIDHSVYFAKNHVLIVRKTLHQGLEYVQYSIVNLKGVVEKSEIFSQNDSQFEFWENIHGKFFQGSSILHVTPSGVAKQDVVKGTYTRLKDTEGVITITDRLFRFGNSVGVARRNAILSISKK